MWHSWISKLHCNVFWQFTSLMTRLASCHESLQVVLYIFVYRAIRYWVGVSCSWGSFVQELHWKHITFRKNWCFQTTDPDSNVKIKGMSKFGNHCTIKFSKLQNLMGTKVICFLKSQIFKVTKVSHSSSSINEILSFAVKFLDDGTVRGNILCRKWMMWVHFMDTGLYGKVKNHYRDKIRWAI